MFLFFCLFVLAIIFVSKLNAIATLNVKMTANVINVDTNCNNLFKPEKKNIIE